MGTRYSPPRHHPAIPHPGYTPLPHLAVYRAPHRPYTEVKEAVGLRSVAQLSLYDHFSGSRGMTEGYNLRIAGNPNDHKSIPGTKKAGVSNPWTGHLFSQQSSIKCQITLILDHGISEGRDMGI